MHRTTERFWECYANLPPDIRELADKNFRLLQDNPRHPSLQFKRVGAFWSARVGLAPGEATTGCTSCLTGETLVMMQALTADLHSEAVIVAGSSYNTATVRSWFIFKLELFAGMRLDSFLCAAQ